MTHHAGVSVFFYGSYMSFDVLKAVGIGERNYETAQLMGYELVMGSSTNVRKRQFASVFGIVTSLIPPELETLYGQEAQSKLGALYLPEPVLVMTSQGYFLPAICYVADTPVTGTPSGQYLETILSACRQYGFPQHYIQHIESFHQ